MSAQSETPDAKLTLTLSADSGYECEQECRISTKQWEQIQRVINGTERQLSAPGTGLAEISLKYSRLASGTLSVFPAKMEMHTDGSTHNADITVLFQQAIAEALRAPQLSAPGAGLADGDTWSFLRDVLLQGASIHQDYEAGRYKSYEEYSARLDEAARERDEKLAALRAPQAAPSAPAARGWQPIETAPKTGESILVWQPWKSGRDCKVIAWYANGWIADYDYAMPLEPTLWQPLPDAPVTIVEDKR